MSETIGFEVELEHTHAQAIDIVIDALKQEGFGVLTRIDIHDAFREKLGVNFRAYTILGACNPSLAHEALSAASEAGLLLPCNVTVEDREGGGSVVRIVNPKEMMRAGGFANDKRITSVGSKAYAGLKRVVDLIRSA